MNILSRLAETEWKVEQMKLRGMCEIKGKVELPSHACDAQTVCSRIYKAANVIQVKQHFLHLEKTPVCY